MEQVQFFLAVLALFGTVVSVVADAKSDCPVGTHDGLTMADAASGMVPPSVPPEEGPDNVLMLQVRSSLNDATMPPPMVKNTPKNVTMSPPMVKNMKRVTMSPSMLRLLEFETKSKKSRKIDPTFESTGKTQTIASALSAAWKGDGAATGARETGPFRTTIGASMQAGASMIGAWSAGGSVDPLSAAASVGLPLLTLAFPMLGMAVSICYSFVSGFLGGSTGPMAELYGQIMTEVGDMIQTEATRIFLEQSYNSSIATLKDILEEMDWVPNMLDQISEGEASPIRYMGCFKDQKNVVLDSAAKISPQSGRNNPETCMTYCTGYIYAAAYANTYTPGMYGCACFSEWELTSTVEDSECSACLNSDLESIVSAASGSLTGSFQGQSGNDYVEVGNIDQGSTITLDVMCEAMGFISLQAEVMLENGVSAMLLQVDSQDLKTWRMESQSQDWTWSTDSPTWAVGPGRHQVKLYSNWNAIKIKRLQFPVKRSATVLHTSCFFHSVPASSDERSVLAASATVATPFENRGGYVQYPEGQGNNKGSIVFDMMCVEASDVRFVASAITPNGQADSWYLAVDTQAEQKWVTGQSTTWAWTHESPSFTVSAGVHTVTLTGREDGVDIKSLKLQDGYGATCVFHSSRYEFEFVGKGGCTSDAHTLQEGLTMAECQSACNLDDACMAFDVRLGQCTLHTSFVTLSGGYLPDSQCWRKSAMPPQRCGSQYLSGINSVTVLPVYEIFTPKAMKADRDRNMELSYYAMFQNDLATGKSAFWFPHCVTFAEGLLADPSYSIDNKHPDCKKWQEMGTLIMGINHAHQHLMTLIQIAIIKPEMRASILERFRNVGMLYMLLAQDSFDTLVLARGEAISSVDDIEIYDPCANTMVICGIRHQGGSRRRSGGGCNFGDSWSGTETEVELNEENCGSGFNLDGACCKTDYANKYNNEGCMNNWIQKGKDCRTHYQAEKVNNLKAELQPMLDDLETLVKSAG